VWTALSGLISFPLCKDEIENTSMLFQIFVAVDPPNVMLKTVKRAEDLNGVVLRLCELAG
jgi:alpha-mannosidase